MSDRKRPLETNGEGSNKKFKSDTTANDSSSSGTQTSAALIAQKRAEIAAKMAAMKNAAFGSGLAAPAPKLPGGLSKLSTSASISSGPTPATGSPASGTSKTPTIPEDLARRVAEAKKKVADAQSKLTRKDNLHMNSQAARNKNRAPEPVQQQGVGLKMAAHPLLLDTTPAAPQSKKDRYRPMQPKFASIKANSRNAPTPPPVPVHVPVPESSNPYTATASAKDTGFDGVSKERVGRSFRFNARGKYVQLADQLRNEQKMEELKQRIAEAARKTGMDGEIRIEKTIKRAPPPDAEWWDTAFLPNQNYDDVAMGMHALNIKTNDSPVTIYIQHPIPIPAPGDRNKIEAQPLLLTKKEQKKMRKLRRASELQDKRDRIRMGLLPPDPPKVRLANLMKVLTSDAVQDPTRVEARVRREVAMRKHGHDKMNSERKLNADEKREKLEAKKAKEEQRGIYGAVFRIQQLSDPAHQFKVRKNAEQLNLTGACLFNPAFSMVFVEGAPKFIRNYKRLMLHRISWTEAARPRGGEEVVLAGEDDASGSAEKSPESGDVPEGNLEDNTCYLVWEGLLSDRSFNSFKVKSCPTDNVAREFLGERLRGYWDMSKNFKAEEEELF